MSTTSTNIPPSQKFSMLNDWTTTGNTILGANYVAQKRVKQALILTVLVYITACVFHSLGGGFMFVNLVVGAFAMIALIMYALKPLVLGTFIAGGSIYAAADGKTDLGPGVKAGLEALGRLVNAMMMFTGVTLFFLGTYPFTLAVPMYVVLPLGCLLLLNISIYERMKTEGWIWKVGGTYVIIVIIIGALMSMPLFRSMVGWVDVQMDYGARVIENHANTGVFEAPLTAEELARQQEVAAQQAAIEAARQAEINKAEEQARKAAQVEASLPKTVKVAKCNEAMTSWSEAVSIPANWFVQADWGGKQMKVSVLLDGVWTLQTSLNLVGEITAVRYCTTSTANLEIREGIMPLHWAKN